MATVRVRIAILTVRITLSVCPFNRMAHTANNGPKAIQNSLLIMKKDPHLKSLFKLGMKSLHEDADDEIVAKLHDELLLNVFHAEIDKEWVESSPTVW
jgi:hypothetical protein